MSTELVKPMRDSKGLWMKGVSGNPSGRKPMPEEIREMLEEKTPEAMSLIIQKMNDETEDTVIRLKCAELIIAYGIGKPRQSVDLDSTVQDLPQIIIQKRKRKDEVEIEGEVV